MNQHYYAVIMAGGGGTRLWPLSRKETPKQMLKIFGERTLFQIAIQRLEGVFAADHILVVTVADQAAKLKEQWPEIPDENYLIEPMPRGTASVVGMAAVALANRDREATMAILTADHFIQDEVKFRELLNAGCDLAQQGYLVTLGIHPTTPATGYGYIQRGERLGSFQGMEAFRVLSFKEKPDEAHARLMLQSGDHDWNSGMFIWRVDRILEEFGRHMPVLSQELEQISRDWDNPKRDDTLRRVWPGLKAETIDYGIMEKADNVIVAPGDFFWDDLGAWPSLEKYKKKDVNGNVSDGEVAYIDVNNTFMLSTSGMIAAFGVKDLIIIKTGDADLVCHRSKLDDMKHLLKALKADKNFIKYT
jgi:mannose-1-phosphate guanylyltransferase